MPTQREELEERIKNLKTNINDEEHSDSPSPLYLEDAKGTLQKLEKDLEWFKGK